MTVNRTRKTWGTELGWSSSGPSTSVGQGGRRVGSRCVCGSPVARDGSWVDGSLRLGSLWMKLGPRRSPYLRPILSSCWGRLLLGQEKIHFETPRCFRPETRTTWPHGLEPANVWGRLILFARLRLSESTLKWPHVGDRLTEKCPHVCHRDGGNM